MEEVRYHQATYGGRVSVLKRFHEEVVEEIDRLDAGLDIVTEQCDWVEDEKKYYILNVSDRTNLTNGFRYIKELLLQHHNFKMYNDYKSLIDNGIEVFSVKTDAFTIKTINPTVKARIDFHIKLADGEFLKLRILISQLMYKQSMFRHLKESN